MHPFFRSTVICTVNILQKSYGKLCQKQCLQILFILVKYSSCCTLLIFTKIFMQRTKITVDRKLCHTSYYYKVICGLVTCFILNPNLMIMWNRSNFKWLLNELIYSTIMFHVLPLPIQDYKTLTPQTNISNIALFIDETWATNLGSKYIGFTCMLSVPV